MTIHEFGTENKNVIVLIHPSLVMWDYFEYLIPLMQNRYHLIIPALPGYDESRPRDFTSVKEVFPGTYFRRYKTVGHGGLAALAPEKLAKALNRFVSY